MTGWERWSTENCARDWILAILETMLENEMHKTFSTYQQKKGNYYLVDFAIPMNHSENNRKWKVKQILGPC